MTMPCLETLSRNRNCHQGDSNSNSNRSRHHAGIIALEIATTRVTNIEGGETIQATTIINVIAINGMIDNIIVHPIIGSVTAMGTTSSIVEIEKGITLIVIVVIIVHIQHRGIVIVIVIVIITV
jgi:hypothetical protein